MIDFNQMIDNHLKRELKPKIIGRYYPSEIGHCLRKTWYSYKFPTEIKPELARVFEAGNILHDFVVKVLSSGKTSNVDLVSAEVPFKHEVDDFIISGRIDDLILLKDINKQVLIEVKSTSGIEYITEPAPHNAMQLQLYMYKLGIHDGVLLYLDKRDLKSKVFTVPYDEAKAIEIINKFKELHTHLKNETLPTAEARKDRKKSWMCKQCEYKDMCYEATPKSFELP